MATWKERLKPIGQLLKCCGSSTRKRKKGYEMILRCLLSYVFALTYLINYMIQPLKADCDRVSKKWNSRFKFLFLIRSPNTQNVCSLFYFVFKFSYSEIFFFTILKNVQTSSQMHHSNEFYSIFVASRKGYTMLIRIELQVQACCIYNGT